MKEQKVDEALCTKLGAAMRAYMETLLRLSPAVLIEKAQEIAVTRSCYARAMSGGYDPKTMSALLYADDPLQMLRERAIHLQNTTSE